MSESNLWYQRLPLTKEVNTRILTEEVRQRARIGRSHWETSFQAIPNNMPYKAKILGYCRKLEEYEQDGISWVLYGKLGSGKTTLGALILKYALAKGGRVLFFRASDMLDRLKSFKPQFAPNEAPLDIALTHVNFLLVDDLQNEEGDRLRKLETILRHRQDERLPTIITTNMTKDQVKDVAWLGSFIDDRYKEAEVVGLDWRKNPPNLPTTDSLL